MPRLSTRRSAAAAFDMHYGPNMTPMVDVTLVILIFFMASAAFLGPEWFVNAALPVRAAQRTPEPDSTTRLRVTLSPGPGGRGTLADAGDQHALSPAALDAFLTGEARRLGPANLIVIVEPAPTVPYEDVVRVHEACARLGIKVGLAP